MDEDILMVFINYRLDLLGFLTTGDKAIRGNMGLKDQNMALMWVQKNIHIFEGDPNQPEAPICKCYLHAPKGFSTRYGHKVGLPRRAGVLTAWKMPSQKPMQLQ
ncbi:unnamed protein product [Allacma fusca]|uniref:Carboxylesterase type B domain-containing protein n=1 Tax=Allacma fusca TaxID=39272 RepID=A0A8J2P3R0_9HEXA|nr:unnamed protein product [Allacma fusca]